MSKKSPVQATSSVRASLARRILHRASDGTMHLPPEIPGLTLVRIDQPNQDNFCVYESCVAVIVQGSKRIHLGDETITYSEGRYLISAMDLPVKSVVMQASPEQPYLTVVLRLDWREIASLMMETQAPSPLPLAGSSLQDNRAMATGVTTEPLLDAFDRLLELLDQPEHIPALAPMIKREIHYRLLVGETGSRLRQIATVGSQSHKVVRAIASLKARFSEPLRVEAMARALGMSLSTFHHHFKTLTAMSPLQYQKQLRLTEARRLMLTDGVDASTAAFRVGYESPSQFSREYRRHFGSPPSRDVAGIRRNVAESAQALPKQ